MAESEGNALHVPEPTEQNLHLGVPRLLIADQHHLPHTIAFSFQGLRDMLKEKL